MGYGIKLEVWGDYALFTRPEAKAERASYDIMTPSAARGILDAILWKPAMQWRVRKIHVLNPILFTNIRRNEVGSKINASKVKSAMLGDGTEPLYLCVTQERQQRASMLLKDVRYVIEADFVMTDQAGERDTPEKLYAMAVRRMQKGQYYHAPYLGTREFPAAFRLYEGEQVICPDYLGEQDLGYMLLDMDYSDPQNIKPVFFHAVLQDGALTVPEREVGA